jgi:hypothetical protein
MTPLEAIQRGGLQALQKVLRLVVSASAIDLRPFVTSHRSALQVAIAGLIALPDHGASEQLLLVIAALATHQDQDYTRVAAVHMLIEGASKAKLTCHAALGRALRYVCPPRHAIDTVVRLLGDRHDEMLLAWLAAVTPECLRNLAQPVAAAVPALFHRPCKTRADHVCLLVALTLTDGGTGHVAAYHGNALDGRWYALWKDRYTPSRLVTLLINDPQLHAERRLEQAAQRLATHPVRGIEMLARVLCDTPLDALPIQLPPYKKYVCPIQQTLYLADTKVLQPLETDANVLSAWKAYVRACSPEQRALWSHATLRHVSRSKEPSVLVWSILEASSREHHLQHLHDLTHRLLRLDAPIATIEARVQRLDALGYDTQAMLWRLLQVDNLLVHRPWLACHLMDWRGTLTICKQQAQNTYVRNTVCVLIAAEKKHIDAEVGAWLGRDPTTLVAGYLE